MRAKRPVQIVHGRCRRHSHICVAYQADEAVLVEELIAQFGQRVRGVEARARHLDA